MASEMNLNIISPQNLRYAQHVKEKRKISVKQLQSAFINSSKTTRGSRFVTVNQEFRKFMV